jgi:hypothetical protein
MKYAIVGLFALIAMIAQASAAPQPFDIGKAFKDTEKHTKKAAKKAKKQVKGIFG